MMLVFTALERMFNGFAQSARMEMIARLNFYFVAIKEFDIRDILTAIDAFAKGKVKDASMKFAPTATELYVEIEVQRDRREQKERHGVLVRSKTPPHETAFHRKLKTGLIPPLGKGNYRYTALDALNTLPKMPF